MKTMAVIFCFQGIFWACATQGDMSSNENVGSPEFIWDLATLQDPPDFTWTNQEARVWQLLYSGPQFLGQKTKVFALYSNPDILRTGRGDSTKKYPGVILIHGGGGKAFPEWVEKWAEEGYAAMAMDLSGNGGDGNRLTNGGPEQSRANKFQSIQKGFDATWTYYHVQSIVLAHSLIRNLPEVDQNRTAVTGISWGGYLTCIVASIDDRFKAACPVYGCGFFDEITGAAEDFDNLGVRDKVEWTKFLDPKNYLPYADQPILFINGNTDGFFDILPYHKTYSLIPDANRYVRITPNMEHSHRHGWEPPEIKEFFDHVLADSKGLPKLGHVVSNNNILSVELRSPVGLSSAEFYYSTDSSSTNHERTWKSTKAEITSNSVKTRFPEADFYLGFFYVTDTRGLSMSSELVLSK